MILCDSYRLWLYICNGCVIARLDIIIEPLQRTSCNIYTPAVQRGDYFVAAIYIPYRKYQL